MDGWAIGAKGSETMATVRGLGRTETVKPVFAPDELAQMQPVIDAVCVELGLAANEKARRKAVAERVMSAFRRGRHLPLYMVDAGLAERPPA